MIQRANSYTPAQTKEAAQLRRPFSEFESIITNVGDAANGAPIRDHRDGPSRLE
jgi:hypothetical protein